MAVAFLRRTKKFWNLQIRRPWYLAALFVVSMLPESLSVFPHWKLPAWSKYVSSVGWLILLLITLLVGTRKNALGGDTTLIFESASLAHTDEDSPSKVTPDISPEVQYTATNDRRSKNFEFFWQAVALSLAAQAFLLTTALGGGTSNMGRYMTSSLSIVVSAAALSLMHSQKKYQRIEAGWLDYFENPRSTSQVMSHGSDSKDRDERLREAEESISITRKAQKKSKPFIIGYVRDRILDATFMWGALMVAFASIDVAVIVCTAKGVGVFV